MSDDIRTRLEAELKRVTNWREVAAFQERLKAAGLMLVGKSNARAALNFKPKRGEPERAVFTYLGADGISVGRVLWRNLHRHLLIEKLPEARPDAREEDGGRRDE